MFVFLSYCPYFRTIDVISFIQKQRKRIWKGASFMKGYYNNSGYMGYVEGRWVLFACEQDYTEYMGE